MSAFAGWPRTNQQRGTFPAARGLQVSHRAGWPRSAQQDGTFAAGMLLAWHEALGCGLRLATKPPVFADYPLPPKLTQVVRLGMN